ncbi:UDP-N-acetylglucosamine 2-epimerase (non-hydrolysing) [Bacillus sp. V-88]|jgi:UDP-N-acetylglucosamine 2-epimerase (non-hydrolysing)|uniref:UDP-N-acetylglucosamine 2-epimerase (Non-hydrolyzing) n=1 Tax=Rossellomorea vietnamensis TaxID=218284 RepID=A0A6I6UR37_9BACI|nr:UDP-N-acetylglucosamine 2-epimerase (non-hydrolyzing) [Rossellomorea vietnamensis]OXS56029.1 UDP-N-acetylglucosamine 2-epimerase (non-hydrolyzing) [Bacillus sp. DSM 27956]PRX71760.1 UDP-N-acetylglucosamine 2-epimerase (non-hydrolysing) [Bacillus sp. V-88]QHE61373.1 UDP-N-acetylglucosamine 2-epimerase (non-hydrolyzing) [Rossellomorea vietnamensis]SLK24396.1 UDP-N-acetylglucosamine 2-epimerase (non-hydrolysing) [Bacillus sp. V-88]
MKIVTVLGTRPEIIRLSLIMKKLDLLADEHIIVHTGQNFTHSLNGVFFKELGLREPDYVLADKQQSLGEQLSSLFTELEKILVKERPDKVLVLGDTNSGLSAILAERMMIPVVHMEAGNRCFDLNVPEEKNRKIIDAVSSYNLVYTPYSKTNLLKEGMTSSKIIITGNPIFEVLTHYDRQIEDSSILHQLSLGKQDYFLATIHRAENVDNPIHLSSIINALNELADTYKKRIILSTHPRTRSKLHAASHLQLHPLIELHEPFGFFDFIKLEKNTFCALTDSGTVQEECCIFHIPTVTIRKTTERPETVDCGSNFISGLREENIITGIKVMTSKRSNWACPAEYLDGNVSDKVINILLGGSDIVY